MDRAMRMIAALVALAIPGSALAAEANPKASLACEVVENGGRTKLPAKPLRLEEPVACKLSIAGAARPEPFAARLVTTWTEYTDAGKKVPKKSDRHTGQVNGGAPWTATLAPDQDFIGCLDFVIEAALTAPGAAKPAWSKKIKIKQFCPD
jgi:hypothetical protein